MTTIAHYKTVGFGHSERSVRAGEVSPRAATDLDLFYALLRREDLWRGTRGYCPPDGQESTDEAREAAAWEWLNRYPAQTWVGSKEWPMQALFIARQVTAGKPPPEPAPHHVQAAAQALARQDQADARGDEAAARELGQVCS